MNFEPGQVFSSGKSARVVIAITPEGRIRWRTANYGSAAQESSAEEFAGWAKRSRAVLAETWECGGCEHGCESPMPPPRMEGGGLVHKRFCSPECDRCEHEMDERGNPLAEEVDHREWSCAGICGFPNGVGESNDGQHRVFQ